MYELKGFQSQGLFYVNKTNIINYMTCYIKVITIHAPKELNFKTSRFFFVKMIKHTLTHTHLLILFNLTKAPFDV